MKVLALQRPILTYWHSYTNSSEPERDGYIFEGWYTEIEYLNRWNFEEDVKGDDEIIIYALWASEIHNNN